MRTKLKILGLVQGIGFRPFVAELAEELNIYGWVRNTGGIVTILASGSKEAITGLRQRLVADIPTGGFVQEIVTEELYPFDEEELIKSEQDESFVIIQSDSDSNKVLPFIPADIATCDKCQAELLDPANRRYRHPFISCTVCGPRYSILESIPYDRDSITMKDFDMCPECRSEYIKKGDRRRHAQTIACKNCGPRLSFSEPNRKTEVVDEEALNQAITLISRGGILAIKDIGGYHLACSPFNEAAVLNLRKLKHREAKAFAVMLENTEEVRKYAYINDHEKELLESPARPIVLVKRLEESENDFSPSVCLTSPSLGAMLPCNPLQILLIKACGPLVMTSGNGSGDILEIDDGKMLEWMQERAKSSEMAGVELGILSNDRRILRPQDDSVIKSVEGKSQFIRRARGYVPSPIRVAIEKETFAAGGDLKSTFCFVKNRYAYVSQHLGDLENISCQSAYKAEKAAMENIFGFEPEKKAADLHPGYFSSRLYPEAIKVQHHKAHVASVIAEHDLKGEVLGFAFDGTGFGEDGRIWGSEVFSWDGREMKRLAHLKETKLIGGDEGARNCRTILEGFLYQNGLLENETMVAKAIKNNINVVESTSMGRLFDAVSCMLGICEYNSYEGQAPVELENIACQASEVLPLSIGEDGSTAQLFKGILEYQKEKKDTAVIAKSFIYAVADFVTGQARRYGIHQIVLAGGTFLNRILLERVYEILTSEGFEVYFANQLPAGDGGLCLGQAYLVNHIFDIN